MELYQGFDTFSGTTKNTAVRATTIPPTRESEGNLTINVATSMEQLQNALEIEGSMKVSYSVFSVEAKSKYVHELNLTSNSVVVVIYANKLYTTERLDVEIPESILATMNTEAGVDDFVNKYGDSWVSKVVQGGEFYITFTFYSETRNEKELIENSLSAGGVVAGASINASLAMKLSKVINTTNVRYSINQKLVGYSTLTPPSKTTPESYVSDLIAFAGSLLGLEPDSPAMVSYEVAPYDQLLPSSVNFATVTANRYSFLGNPAAPGWGEMVTQLSLAMTIANAIKERYKFYNHYQDQTLDVRLATIKNDLNYLYRFISSVDAKPNRDHPFTIPESLLYGIPRLMYSVVVPTEQRFLNGGGGGPYQDVQPGNIPQHIHLNMIRISNGTVVDVVAAKYATEYPAAEFAQMHGTPGGRQHQEFFLGPDEYVTKMGGKLENYWGHSTVSVLYFVTNKGNAYASSDDAQKDADQVWEAKPGDLLIGFSGSSGNNVDCIQPVVVRFSPAKWDELSLRIDTRTKADAGRPPVGNEVLESDIMLAAPRPAQVVNIDPGPGSVNLGRIATTLHIYNTGRPAGGDTTYWMSFQPPRIYVEERSAPGHTKSYDPGGKEVFVENKGPSMLQALW